MKKIIPDLQAFPVDAQSNLFFCALSSVLLKALGYTEDRPFFCGQKRHECVECGNCTNKTTMMKHHLQLYHDYQTITGVGLGWDWPESYDIAYIMNAAGLLYKRLDKTSGEDQVLSALAASVDAGIPVLMKLGNGDDWHVVTGYDDSGVLYGLDAHKHCGGKPAISPDRYTDDGLFAMKDWYQPLVEAIVITGRTEPSVGFADMLRRMIAQLSLPENATLEADVMHRIDAVEPDNARELAAWLNNLAGFAVEARWHGAECFGATLVCMTDDESAKEKLYTIADKYFRTHDLCWEIWGKLGVGTATNYALSPESGELVQREENKADLKRLFSDVFSNDRTVLGLLREIVG